MTKCLGCAAILQDIDSNKPGYVKDLSYSYCERCFRNKHYSETKELDTGLSNDDIINKINKESNLTFFIVDFLNISDEIIDLYKKISSLKYLVINKMDIVPKDININRITNLLKNNYDITDNIIFDNKNSSKLTTYFKDYQNIYFCGISNSGKSTIISDLTNNKDIIKTNMINSTLDFNSIDLDNHKLIDCPGFIINTNIIDSKLSKIVVPTKVLKIRNYNIKKDTTLNFHDLFKITFINDNNISCYVSNGIVIKKEYKSFNDYEIVKVSKDTDLIILGIGFINIKKDGEILINKDLKWEVRNSLFRE